MNYQIGTHDNLCQDDGFGPFHPDSVDKLNSALADFERTKVVTTLELLPVQARTGLRPKFIPFEGVILFVLTSCISITEKEFFRIAHMADVIIKGWGHYTALRYQDIERRFASTIDFERSIFDVVSRGTLTLGPSIPWRVKFSVRGADPRITRADGRKRSILDVAVASLVQLRSPWPADYFVFDRRTYFRYEVISNDLGLRAVSQICKLVDPEVSAGMN